MLEYDYLIVGAGLYGCTIARLLTDAGKKVLVIDKRDNIGGNCASENIHGIDVHLYGPHVFHTSNKSVWQFVNKYADFYQFAQNSFANYEGKLYNLPINKKTLQDVIQYQKCANFQDAKEKAIDMFIKPYSEKQWGCDFEDVPKNALKRLPVRYNYFMGYHNDFYCGVPVDGWNGFFEKLTDGIDIELNKKYVFNEYSENQKIIYTGAIDEYFSHFSGCLDWRSIYFVFENYISQDHQGCSVIHYPAKKYKYTRVTEFKHFLPFANDYNNYFTTICKEIPCENIDNPMYPVETEKNLILLKKYETLAAKEKNVFFAGRLGTYKYNNMDTTIENAFKDMEKYI